MSNIFYGIALTILYVATISPTYAHKSRLISSMEVTLSSGKTVNIEKHCIDHYVWSITYDSNGNMIGANKELISSSHRRDHKGGEPIVLRCD